MMPWILPVLKKKKNLQGIFSFKMCITYRIPASILDSTNQQKHMVGCVYFFPTYIEGLEIETLLICVFILMSRAEVAYVWESAFPAFLQEGLLSFSYKIKM